MSEESRAGPLARDASWGEGFDDIHRRVGELFRAGEDGAVDALDFLLAAGAKSSCSDIHLEPQAERLRIRFRVFGTLRTAGWLPRAQGEKLLARLKVAAKLVTYQKRLPQDGRLRLSHEGVELDLRVSLFPAIHGEKAVLRFPGSSKPLPALDELGLPEAAFRSLEERLAKTQGTILLTGPAGSGKTTTMYAALRHIQNARADACHIVTLEDPVERDLEGVTQSQVHPVGGITFASGFKAILRQDPDVILIGEIRDRETAEAAVQAGLTGHLILSTVHSGTAAGVFTRLLHLDVEPYLVASSVTCVAAQRLVKTVCPSCAAEAPAPEALLVALPGGEKFRGRSFKKGRGCGACAGSGYGGRTGVFEFILVDDDLRDLLMKRSPTRDLLALAAKKGQRTLLDDALEKASAGVTTLDEVLRLV